MVRRVPKRLVSDVASHKNKEVEFQSSGCQAPSPRARVLRSSVGPNLTDQPMPPGLRTHTHSPTIGTRLSAGPNREAEQIEFHFLRAPRGRSWPKYRKIWMIGSTGLTLKTIRIGRRPRIRTNAIERFMSLSTESR